jgi:hypothetical protein
LEKASPIDVDAAETNTVSVYSKIEELCAECEVAWQKTARPLEQLIRENNLTVLGLKERDVQLARWEDIMYGRVCANRVKIGELQAKVGVVTPWWFNQD